MSKYIITDNTIALSEIKSNNYYYCRVTNNPELKNVIIYNCQFSNGVTGDFYQIPETLVKKEADTIEELCDEFIYDNELLAPMYISPKEPLIESWRNRLDDEFNYKNHKEIYGAIWTPKGLIYVAKMNDKGKLELI